MQIERLSWFPGHMTKTKRMIVSEIGHMDAVCEIVDARIPQSSRNPDVDELTAGKPRLMVLNRVDQADPAETKKWAAAFRAQGFAVLEANARGGVGTEKFAAAVRELLKDKLAAYAEKGQVGRTIRVMVLGIPNVGKSTFINKVAKRKTARAEDRPGVTRSKQWVPVDATLELLDTPGILWPKFDDTEVGKRLAFTGAIKDDVLDIEELACYLMDYLAAHYADVLRERYRIDVEEGDSGYELLEKRDGSGASLCGARRWIPNAWPVSCWMNSEAASWDALHWRRWRTAEMRETADLWAYEREAREQGYTAVCGVDEAGAGPLMGPVYAAAVILPEDYDLPELNDSKKLTEKKREMLFPLIKERAIAWSVAWVEASEIDATDILSARMKAMQMAIDGLSVTSDMALIDGNRDKGHSAAISTAHRCIVGGDGKSASIAAASVLAKVSRDHYVTEVLDKAYPQYQFARHKGYGTKLHYEMLDKYGPCPEHRRSFLKKWEAKR